MQDPKIALHAPNYVQLAQLIATNAPTIEMTRLLAGAVTETTVRRQQATVRFDHYGGQLDDAQKRWRQRATEVVAEEARKEGEAARVNRLLAGAAACEELRRQLPYLMNAAMIELALVAAQFEREAREGGQ